MLYAVKLGERDGSWRAYGAGYAKLNSASTGHYCAIFEFENRASGIEFIYKVACDAGHYFVDFTTTTLKKNDVNAPDTIIAIDDKEGAFDGSWSQHIYFVRSFLTDDKSQPVAGSEAIQVAGAY